MIDKSSYSLYPINIKNVTSIVMNSENVNFTNIDFRDSNCKVRQVIICQAEFFECKTKIKNCLWEIPFGTSSLCSHANAMSFMEK